MGKQRYGTGSMMERSPGTWRLRAYVRETGEQVQRTFKGNRTGAAKALAALVTEIEQGRFDHTRATFGELLDRWMAQIEPTRTPATLRDYRRKIERIIRPALAAKTLTKLKASDLDDFYGKELAKGLSPATVRKYHAIIAAACHQGVKWGWLAANPADRATPPMVHNAPLSVPEFDQIDTLYRAARQVDEVLGTAVALAALTGARRGELCALRWSGVDLAAGHLRIAHALTVVDGVTYIGDTKTHAARRIALDESAIAVLRDRWAFMVDLSERAESALVSDPFVLSYQAHGGTPVSPDTISHRFAEIAKATGIKCHLHSLRHFSVTTLIAAGVDIRTVAERHGHAHATMTLNRYSHALPERDRVAAGILGKALTAG